MFPRSLPTETGFRCAALIALIGCLLSMGCGRPGTEPETEIPVMLDAAASAAERGDVMAVQAFISADYKDDAGRDRRAVGFLLRSWIGRYQNLLVIVSDLRVQPISAELATADMTVSLLARDSGRPLLTGVDAERLPLRLALRRERGEWRVTRAEWGVDSGFPSGSAN